MRNKGVENIIPKVFKKFQKQLIIFYLVHKNGDGSNLLINISKFRIKV
jgi:hypothetical protein